MGIVNSLTLVDSGTYYTSNPTIIIDAPFYDSANLAAIDSSFAKFGVGSLLHDSTGTSKSIMGSIDSDYGQDSNSFVMQSFWIYLDSVQPRTLLWNSDFRLYITNNDRLAIAYRVDSSQKDSAQTDNIAATRINLPLLTKNNWHFVKVETNHNDLRLSIDNQSAAVVAMGVSTNNQFFYDSGDTINIGYDSTNISPNPKLDYGGGTFALDSNLNKSFTGRLDNYQFTVKSGKVAFTPTTVQDSGDDFYEGVTPVINQQFDYKRATGRALIDSSSNEVNQIILDSGGFGYTTIPNVTFVGGNTTIDSNYRVGDNIRQVLPTTTIRGEVTGYRLDSNGDSNRYLFLTHVGADNGAFKEFIINGDVINTTLNSPSGLYTTAVSEENRISNNEQNIDFSTISDDFLDFSEDNPFGDTENN